LLFTIKFFLYKITSIETRRNLRKIEFPGKQRTGGLKRGQALIKEVNKKRCRSGEKGIKERPRFKAKRRIDRQFS